MKVLVVDDDAINVTILAKFFTSRGMPVSTAYDGAQALVQFEKNQYDLVITDILMPKVEGIEIIGEIRSNNRDVILIAMSSDADVGRSSLLELAEAMGANLCLKKPVSVKMLSEALEPLGF